VKQSFISAKEPYISAKKPFISATKLDISAKEFEISAKEPYISAKEMHIAAPAGWTRAHRRLRISAQKFHTRAGRHSQMSVAVCCSVL